MKNWQHENLTHQLNKLSIKDPSAIDPAVECLDDRKRGVEHNSLIAVLHGWQRTVVVHHGIVELP